MATVAAASQSNSTRNATRMLVCFALFAIILLQLQLAFIKSVNWDEFYHFSIIGEFNRGESVDPLQTPFVWLYFWVPRLPGGTIEHIQMIRTLILPFELLLLGTVYACARRFTGSTNALLCALAYLTAGFVFTQGLALRADVIAASLIMTALTIGFWRTLSTGTLVLMAALCLLAFVSTIKTLLYLPAFAALLYYRRDELAYMAKPFAVLFTVTAASTLAFAILTPDFGAALVAKLQGSAARMFGGGLLPQGYHAIRQVMIGPAFALLLAVFCIWLFRQEGSRDRRITLALLALPAGWPLIYFNSYPYFYAFILPPVAVAIAPAIEYARTRYGAPALVALFSVHIAVLWIAEPRVQLVNQQRFQTEARSAFPQPVTYIDESGMLGDYPRAVSHFASGWALENYLAKGVPEYRNAVLGGEVPLLIANSEALLNLFAAAPDGDRLLPEDEAFLRTHFIHHSGMMFVAGKQLDSQQEDEALIATPGTYRVEGGPLSIDGSIANPGSAVQLERKRYALTNLSDSSARLRWAEAGEPKASNIHLGNLFSNY